MSNLGSFPFTTFKEYQEQLLNSSAFKDYPEHVNWVATKKSKTGEARIAWANAKLKEYGWDTGPGCWAKLMFEVHPFKAKACSCCNKIMSLDYIYLNKNLIRKLNSCFEYLTPKLSECYNVFDLLDDLYTNDLQKCIDLFKCLFGPIPVTNTKNNKEILLNYFTWAVYSSRTGQVASKLLGPGAMSNFPDRLDGFHTYNRCCRSIQDKGRSPENMAKYSKDRRAYEYWVDGNFQRGNAYMKSFIFKNTTADHIGPISLGFVHDYYNLQPMDGSSNSSKRDTLTEQAMLMLQENSPLKISWFSKDIWEFIVNQFKSKGIQPWFGESLKQSLRFYLLLMYKIKMIKNGENFIKFYYLQPKEIFFKYEYSTISDNEIKITLKQPSEQLNKEISRFHRVSLNSLSDVFSKQNRRTPVMNSGLADQAVKHLANCLVNWNQSKNDETIKIASYIECIIRKHNEFLIQQYSCK